MKNGIPTLSLFSGAGGLDIGFHNAGFDIVACVEIEPSYARTLSANVGKGKFFGASPQVFCQDIRKFDPAPFKSAGIRCVIGGPPCQTFSAAGRRSGGVIGIGDDRGQLFVAYCNILKALRPEVFVFENVYGITGANGGGPWRAIVTAFSELGYTLRSEVVDSADYGAPQHRERLIIVGSKARDFEFPIPTHGPDSPSGKPLVSVLDVIKDLQGKSEPFQKGVGGLYGHLLPKVPEGLNYAFFTAEMGHPEPLFAWRSKFHDLLYKVNRNEPCRTIKAQPGKFTGPFHWKNRHFTIAELKRLQSFPDSYEILGNFNTVLEQIGNSVPPVMAEVMAVAVREQLLDKPKRLTYPSRPFGFKSTFRQRQRERSARFKTIAKQAIEEQYKVSGALRKAKVFNESYYLTSHGLFDIQRLASKPKPNGADGVFKVSVRDPGKEVKVVFSRADRKKPELWAIDVKMTGLSKYLGRIDGLQCDALLGSPPDVFHAWNAIGEVLTSRSRFFSLIDIYGHYANRGDTIRVETKVEGVAEDVFMRAIGFFGRSENCGDFISERALCQALEIEKRQLSKLVEQLREIRFDVRTELTHPIIGPGRVICTYPFPLLSKKALVESRVQMRNPAQQELMV
jgi:DNA (cytosine-5)-methyltransferase 1